MTIDVTLVRQLLEGQFPQWADLPIEPVEPGGKDNRTFRLGEEMSVRLPSAERYVEHVRIGHEWLPRAEPSPAAADTGAGGRGLPGPGYPWPWTVNRWIEG